MKHKYTKHNTCSEYYEGRVLIMPRLSRDEYYTRLNTLVLPEGYSGSRSMFLNLMLSEIEIEAKEVLNETVAELCRRYDLSRGLAHDVTFDARWLVEK